MPAQGGRFGLVGAGAGMRPKRLTCPTPTVYWAPCCELLLAAGPRNTSCTGHCTPGIAPQVWVTVPVRVPTALGFADGLTEPAGIFRLKVRSTPPVLVVTLNV